MKEMTRRLTGSLGFNVKMVERNGSFLSLSSMKMFAKKCNEGAGNDKGVERVV